MDITLKVPAEALDEYKAAEPWKNFWNIVAIEDSGVDAIAIDANITVEDGSIVIPNDIAACGVSVFDMTGKCVYRGVESSVNGLAHGIYIVKTVKAATKVIL